MAFAYFDRVKETSTTTGTGNISLGGAVSGGFREFSAVYANADTLYYCITDQSGNDWEVGLGTYNSSGDTLTRTTVLASSNSNNAVNFTSGSLFVFATIPAAAMAKSLLYDKAFTQEAPLSGDKQSLFYTDVAITITKMVFVLTGSSTPSVTATIRHSTDRSATGNEVVTSGTTTTSITSGSVVTSFNDATIPAGSFVWWECTAKSGTVTSYNGTLIYTKDP